jgi:LacI family transcriptional regulator
MVAERRARLKDVAALAGVSESTASKVLNGSSSLSARPDTQARVLSAAEHLEYRPHAAARHLAGTPSRMLAMLVPDLANPGYVAIIRGAYHRARFHGYTMLLAEDIDGQSAAESLSDLVLSGRVDGLIVASARPEHRLVRWLDGHWAPHVFVNRSVPDSSRNVVMSFGGASTVALGHLIGLGHRAIGHVGGPEGIGNADERATAFAAYLRKRGLPEAAMVRVGFDERSGAAGLEALLASHPQLTAVYTSSFAQAVGVLHACNEMALDVPGRLSVVAYDDLPLANYLVPALTTIAMPQTELGSAAVDALVDQLAGKPPRNVAVRLPARLMIRASTAPPPALP